MEKTRILVVDDEKHIAELISLYLMKEGYETREVYDGRKAMDEFYSFKPELVMLDIMLPGMDGYQVCTTIRKNSDVPIIMLTARSDTFDKVLGLEMGADDYIVKPFEPKEMVARVKAVLRRYEKSDEKESNKTVSFENLKISLNDYT
ncbi:MAG: response regulator transcription factor, partial [Eubacteriales bacterium]|nr:response regulator transcription factor [Eubacteriales bacterium]